MKVVQKVTRLKLKIKQTEDSIYLGIVSSEADYKLSLAINNKIKISLKSLPPVIIRDENGPGTVFSRFAYSADSNDTFYSLISNRSAKNFLFKKLRNIDYILHVTDDRLADDIDTLLSGLGEIDIITAVFIVSSNIINDKNLKYLNH